MEERRGVLAESLEGLGRPGVDEEDLATLRRWYGHARSITYNADDHGDTRWDARPRANVGRDGEKITAPSADLLARRLAETGLVADRQEAGR